MTGRIRYDLTGQRFGKLVAISSTEPDRWGASMWLCQCDCGEQKIVAASSLRRNASKSCGCSKRGPRRDDQKNPGTHGGSRHVNYNTWINMRRRCTNPEDKSYPDYGGRGIRVCDRWDDFNLFVLDVGERPAGYSLDRIDNDGNYEPGNVRWIPIGEQASNRRAPRRNRDFDRILTELQEWKDRALAAEAKLGISQ